MARREIDMPKNAVIAQGGGPTAVINQSLVGAVLEAGGLPEIGRMYGAMHGVRGIVDETFLDLTMETAENLELVAATPSSALGSTRDKPDRAYCQNIMKALAAHDVGYFLYIGGNDSSDTVRIVAEEAGNAGHDLRAIHIPKTIDNDLMENDHTPGFGSAARFVAQALMGINLDNRSLPGVYIAVIMGRHAGFLTAATALARRYPDDGPHIVCLPERAFDMDAFLAKVKATHEKYGRCVVAVSEGIHDSSGDLIAARLMKTVERDAHGNVSLSGTGALADLLADTVKSRLGISRVRADTFGYMQRAFAGCVSDTDAREAREVGRRAVKAAVRGDRNGSVAIKRIGDYAVDYALVPLEAVAAKTKVMADALIADDGMDVTPAFLDYCRPLIGTGLPQIHRLSDSNRLAK